MRCPCRSRTRNAENAKQNTHKIPWLPRELALDTVGLRCNICLASKHRELTSCTTPNKLCALESRIVKKGGNFDIVHSTLSGLVVGREAPAVGLTLLGDDNAAIWGRCDILAIDVRNDSRFLEVARSVVLINEQVLLVVVGQLHAALGVVDPAPDKDLTRLSDGKTVVATTNNLLDVETLEVCDGRGSGDGVVIVTLIFGDTGLTEGVEAPRIDLAELVNGKAVVIAAADLGDVLALQTELTRDECANCSSRDDTASKLALFTSAPCKDFALVVKSENVVCTRGERNDILQLGDKSWGALCRDTTSETQDAVIALLMLDMMKIFVRSRRLTRKVPQP